MRVCTPRQSQSLIQGFRALSSSIFPSFFLLFFSPLPLSSFHSDSAWATLCRFISSLLYPLHTIIPIDCVPSLVFSSYSFAHLLPLYLLEREICILIFASAFAHPLFSFSQALLFNILHRLDHGFLHHLIHLSPLFFNFTFTLYS